MGQIADNMRARREWMESVNGQGGGNPQGAGTQPQATDLSSLLSLIANNVNQAQQGQKTYNDLLTQRQGYTQAAENGLGDMAQGLIQNGQGGVPVSPAATLAPVLNFHTDNANKTADYTNRMFGFGQQANEGLSALANVLGQQEQNAIQNKSLNLQYGLDDGSSNGSGASPADNVTSVVSQGGKDLLSQAATPAQEYKLAKDIVKAGGVAQYRTSNPTATKLTPEETQVISNLNNGLTMSYQAQQQLQKSKALQNVLDNPIKKSLARAFLNTGQTELLNGLGLSDADVTALRNLDALQNTSVAAKSKAALGLSSSSKQNQTYLGQVNKTMLSDLNAIQKRYGFGSTVDIPGFSAKPPLDSFN